MEATEDWLFDIPTDYLRYLLDHPFAAGAGRGHTARYMYELMIRAHTDSIHKSGYIVELQWSKEIIMWGSMIPLVACFLVSILWSILQNDVNTGFGLVCPTSILGDLVKLILDRADSSCPVQHSLLVRLLSYLACLDEYQRLF